MVGDCAAGWKRRARRRFGARGPDRGARRGGLLDRTIAAGDARRGRCRARGRPDFRLSVAAGARAGDRGFAPDGGGALLCPRHGADAIGSIIASAARWRSASRPPATIGALSPRISPPGSRISMRPLPAGRPPPATGRTCSIPLVTEIGIAAVAAPAGSGSRNYWALILATPRPERVTGRAVRHGARSMSEGAAGSACGDRAHRHQQELRRGPRQPRHPSRHREGHDPRHRRRERRRQVDADVDPLRLLPGRRGRDPRQRQADRITTPTTPSPPASAWCTSISCWSRISPCSRTSSSAPKAERC